MLGVLARMKEGDFTARMPYEWTGVAGKVADGLNDVITANQALAQELARVSQVVGKEGKVTIEVGGVWKDLTDNVNQLAANLTTQVRAIADVATAVTKGDLTRSIAVEALGEVAAFGYQQKIRPQADNGFK